MRLRIVCKTPARPEPKNPLEFPKVHLYPSHEDTHVFAVDDDGREHPIEGVTYVRFESRPGDVTRACLYVEGVEIDAEGLVRWVDG